MLNKFALYPPSNLNCNPKILSGSKGFVVFRCSTIVGRIVISLVGAGADKNDLLTTFLETMGTESKTIEYEYNQTRISLRSSTDIYIYRYI